MGKQLSGPRLNNRSTFRHNRNESDSANFPYRPGIHGWFNVVNPRIFMVSFPSLWLHMRLKLCYLTYIWWWEPINSGNLSVMLVTFLLITPSTCFDWLINLLKETYFLLDGQNQPIFPMVSQRKNMEKQHATILIEQQSYESCNINLHLVDQHIYIWKLTILLVVFHGYVSSPNGIF